MESSRMEATRGHRQRAQTKAQTECTDKVHRDTWTVILHAGKTSALSLETDWHQEEPCFEL